MAPSSVHIPHKEHTVHWLPVRQLKVVWPDAQRGLKDSKMNAFDLFDPDAFGTIVVSQPLAGDVHHIIDGQHRVEYIRRTYGEAERVPCFITDATSAKRAAEIFDMINNNHSKPSAVTTFKVRVTGGAPAEVAVNRAIIAAGYRVGPVPTGNVISAVTACMAVHKRYGIEVFRLTLETIKQTWRGEVGSMDGTIIRAMAEVLNAHQGRVDLARMSQKLARKFTAQRLIGGGKTHRDMFGGNATAAIRHIIIETYNQNLQLGRLTDIAAPSAKSEAAA